MDRDYILLCRKVLCPMKTVRGVLTLVRSSVHCVVFQYSSFMFNPLLLRLFTLKLKYLPKNQSLCSGYCNFTPRFVYYHLNPNIYCLILTSIGIMV